jgi:hypothetical protein
MPCVLVPIVRQASALPFKGRLTSCSALGIMDSSVLDIYFHVIGNGSRDWARWRIIADDCFSADRLRRLS